METYLSFRCFVLISFGNSKNEDILLYVVSKTFGHTELEVLNRQGRPIMAELSIERQQAVSHSELTGGHEVEHLLSQINQNIRQSKADQILRLLQDHDQINDKVETIEDSSNDLLEEYDLIREEKVICDSDTLTDSSSETDKSDTTVNNIEATETITNRQGYSQDIPNNQSAINMNNSRMNVKSGRESLRGYRRHRARTSVGFHNDMDTEEADPFTRDTNFDTRDLSIRPKSSYVRRNQYRKKDDVDKSTDRASADEFTDTSQLRATRSARPKSRLGRGSVPRSERKIVMMEAEVTPNERSVTEKEDIINPNGNINNMYDRFSSVRQPKRESKRAKAFCDSVVATQQQTMENMSVDSYGTTQDVRDEVTEVQTISNNVRNTHTSTFKVTAPPRNSPVQMQNPTIQMSHKRHAVTNTQVRHEQINSHVRSEAGPGPFHPQQHVTSDPHLIRSDSTVSNNTMRSERPTNVTHTAQVPLKRNNSNINAQGGRPRNPEPVTSRPIERPDMRPNTRARRLHRRYMAPTQSHMSSVRPTSESVILARQKTEKNLMKKQAENRPHSEKIMINSQNKSIDIGLNPTQGPQTYVTTKGGVTQASHVQAGGFRGYDPSSRQRSSKQSRDIQGDLTLPRGGQNNMLMGGRKPLAALMKLPPLEASLAAKKKERGLALAARETCV
ncbi:hypothetical protein ACF0H5_002372 [Mactra antiquata]